MAEVGLFRFLTTESLFLFEMKNVVLAADLGGTNLRMAAVAEDGEVLHLTKTSTPSGVLPDQLIEITSELVDECRSNIDENANICGIAFASPAPASTDCDGILTKLPNLPSLNGMDLKAALLERFSLPIALENDATAAAIGENWLGASKDVANSIMLTLGTGVGGGIIIDNEPFRGIDGTAGEIGHICVETQGHKCGCGSHGCIEQYASATAVVRMANEAGLNFSTSFEVFEAASQGNEAAKSVFQQMGHYLGITLAGLINTLNPEMIVIGGGAAEAWSAFIEPLKVELNYRAFKAPAERVQIVPSKLGDDAGVLGAAWSGFRQRLKYGDS